MSAILLFFFSGAAGLLYEASWNRQLGLLFGQTVQSSSVVLGSYFLGMAIGYRLASSRAATLRRPILGYAACEAVAAAWALVIPFFLALASSRLGFALNVEGSPSLQVGVRALFAFAILMPSTIALGATLPFMAEHVSRDRSSQTAVTAAYAANVAGAVVGVVVGTVYLLIFVGVTRTSYLGAGISLLCAVAAFFLPTPELARTAPKAPVTYSTAARKETMRWQALAAVSGAGILALQVLYTRLFSLVLHNSVYSFGAVVAVFLLGLAGSSGAIAALRVRVDAERWLHTACQAGGIAIPGSLVMFLLQTKLTYFEGGDSFWSYIASVSALVGMVILVPVALLGAVLPLTWRAAEKQESASSVVGRLTAVNTLAAATGALVASFVLLPLLGLWGSFVAVGAMYALAAVALFPAGRSLSNLAVGAATFGFAALAVFTARDFHGLQEDERLLDRWESAYGWVDVIKYEDSVNRQLRLNVHYGLGSTSAVTMERRQAHLPLMLHPNPKDVLFIGLATGITAGAALDHPEVERVDVAELVPDVVRGAATFGDYNRNIVTDPRAKIIINDGRHYLHGTEKRYDAIIADLFVPWESHTGYLYTTENYVAARARLNPGGLFCQWIPLWQLGARELEMIADTFAAVFPTTSMWYGKLDDHWTIVGLIGSEGRLEVDAERLLQRLAKRPPPIPRDKSWLDGPKELMEGYAGDWRPREGAVLNTDEHPRIEFLTPITAWTKDSRLKFETLKAYHADVLSKLPTENFVLRSASGELSDFGPARVVQRRRLWGESGKAAEDAKESIGR